MQKHIEDLKLENDAQKSADEAVEQRPGGRRGQRIRFQNVEKRWQGHTGTLVARTMHNGQQRCCKVRMDGGSRPTIPLESFMDDISGQKLLEYIAAQDDEAIEAARKAED